jgi:hypothetical protein
MVGDAAEAADLGLADGRFTADFGLAADLGLAADVRFAADLGLAADLGFVAADLGFVAADLGSGADEEPTAVAGLGSSRGTTIELDDSAEVDSPGGGRGTRSRRRVR